MIRTVFFPVLRIWGFLLKYFCINLVLNSFKKLIDRFISSVKLFIEG